jgi:hypothetical protein
MNSTTRSPKFVTLQQPGSCDVSIVDFALPVAFGSVAGLGAAFAARKLASHERPGTQDAAAVVAHAVAFWLFGGLTFVLRQRHKH